MAKKTYLQLTNAVLRMLPLNTVSTVVGVTGTKSVVCDSINNAQIHLSNLDDWYELYATELFSTVTYTATTLTFNDANPDTITDSASGFGSFENGQEILISGSANNDGVYTVETAAAGTLTLQSTDSLTAGADTSSITITAISYPVPTDHSRTIDMLDITNDQIIEEDTIRGLDSIDPDSTSTGTPEMFTIQGNQYRLYQIPAGTYKIRVRYFKQPAALATDAATSDLPIELEPALIYYATYLTYNYLGKIEQGILLQRQAAEFIKRAQEANSRKTARLKKIVGRGYSRNSRGLVPYPSTFQNRRRGF